MSDFGSFDSYFRSAIQAKQSAAEAKFLNSVNEAAEICANAVEAGNKIILAGNGGSAADAQHLAAELVVKLRGEFQRPAISAMALTVDTSMLTAISNDYDFESVFCRQLEANGREGDVFIGISTSGNSANIIKAVEVAKSLDIHTIGMSGSGGVLHEVADSMVAVPCSVTSHIQEIHITVGHFICGYIEEKLFSNDPVNPD